MALLLDPSVPPGDEAVAGAAGQTVAVFREVQHAVLDLIHRSETPGH
ncbi:hypothetical protein ACQEVF_57845 [Nonomuraea polychroma]